MKDGAPSVAGSELDSFGLRPLYELLTKLSRAGSLEQVYEAGVTSLLQATEADRASILSFDENGVIQFRAWNGISEDYRRAVAGHTPWQPGQKDAKPLLISNVLTDGSVGDYADTFQREDIAALAFVPISTEAGVIGKFMLYYRAPHQFSGHEVAIAETIANHIALATQRHMAEQAQAISEQRLKAILDNSPTAIFVKNPNGEYLLTNREHERLMGGSLVGKTDRDVFPPETADQLAANDRTVLEKREPVSLEETFLVDGQVRSFLAVKFPVEAAGGMAAGVGGIAFDVTERKKYLEASRRLAAIVANSEDAILSHDLDGKITTWNQGAERLYGYTAQEIIGKPVWTLANPDRPEEMPGIISTIASGGRLEHHETTRRRKDGSLVDVSLTVSPILSETGQVIGVSKIARDITEWIRTEREKQHLLENEQRARRRAELLNGIGRTLAAELDLQKLVQAVTDVGTMLVGAEFGAFFYNTTGEAGGSYKLYSLSGVPEVSAKYTIPENAAVFASSFQGNGPVRSDDISQDSHAGLSGSPVSFPEGMHVRSYLAVPVASRSGEILGGLCFGHAEPGRFSADHEDIVLGLAGQSAIAIDNARLFERQQRVQAELKRSNEGLRQSNRDLQAFAYSASHDLQEPLRNISIYAQLLHQRSGEALGTAGTGYLNNILKGISTLEDLLRDLLAYTTASKREEGPIPKVEPKQVLAQVLERLQERIRSTQAEVLWTDLPPVYAHEGRLAQLFQNLIGNALKYRGKDAPRIEITGEERDGVVVFCVKDNGIGIEPQYAQQIFELFKRLHSRDKYPGSGIGLAICQRIVEHYGGRIWLEWAAPGEGSEFCFTFPARPQ